MVGLARWAVYLAADGCCQCDPASRALLHSARRALTLSGTPLVVVQPGNSQWDKVLEITSDFPALIYNGTAYHNMDTLMNTMKGIA